MGVEVHEAWGDDHSAGINHLHRLMGFEIADLGDTAAFNPNVGLISWHPRSIDYHSPSDKHVEFSHICLRRLGSMRTIIVGVRGSPLGLDRRAGPVLTPCSVFL